MSKIDQNLNDVLGVQAAPSTQIVVADPGSIVPSPTPNIDDPIVNEDFEDARTSIKQVISAASEAVEQILDLAKEGDNPRSYEVLADLVRTVVDANTKLLDIHKKVKEIRIDGTQSGGSGSNLPSSGNTSIFVGSTKDLQLLLRDHLKRVPFEGVSEHAGSYTPPDTDTIEASTE